MSTTITEYNPSGTLIAGNALVGIAVGWQDDINAPSLADLNAGHKVDCAIESLAGGANTSTTTRQKLCNAVAVERPGRTTYTLENLEIVMEDPQEADAFLDSLETGVKVTIFARPGVEHTEALASGDRLWVWHATITSDVPAALDTTEGAEFRLVLSFAVDSFTRKAVLAA